jgi:hypothetical protein
MSTLKADTIVATDGSSPVTLTKQEAVKQWISWDGVNNDIEGSLNVTSVIDEQTGVYTLNITSAYSSQHDRCIFTTLYNSNDDGATIESGSGRGMGTVVVGTNSNSTIDPLTTTTIQFATAYGSSASSQGGMFDLCKVWVTSIGDLA